MPRPLGLVRRLVAGVLALLFAASALEGAAAHACPMHDGTMVAQVLAAARAPATHGGHEAHAAPAQGGEHQGTQHQCTCPDASCGAGGPVAIVAPRLTTHFAIAVADVRAVFAAPASHRPARTPHATPFANGPPAAALA